MQTSDAIIVALVLLIVCLIGATTVEAFESYRGERERQEKYVCANPAPVYGFPETDGIYKYWKDGPDNWRIEYSKERIRGDIDKVRSFEATGNHGTVDTTGGMNVVDQEYYHNPVQYCKAHPDKYPCPNYWLAAAAAATDDTKT